MIRVSSSFSSHSNLTPLTEPCVPTGIKTGVSISERLVRRIPVRALPSCAVTRQSIGFILESDLCPPNERPDIGSADRRFGNNYAVLVDQHCRRRSGNSHLSRNLETFIKHDGKPKPQFCVSFGIAIGKDDHSQ